MESGQARSWRLDGRTIQQVEEKLDDELYKIWNRMSSGSYQAQAVKLITTGQSIEYISMVTGLSVEEVRTLII